MGFVELLYSSFRIFVPGMTKPFVINKNLEATWSHVVSRER